MSDDAISELLGMMRSMQHDFSGHAQKLLDVEKKLDAVITAMPGPEAGGLVGHRMFHERRHIACQEARATKAALKNGVMLWGAIACLGFVAGAIWLMFLSQLPHA